MDEAFLIAGCGYTGLRLAQRLGSRGPVAALARSELAVARLRAEGIEPLRIGNLSALIGAAREETQRFECLAGYAGCGRLTPFTGFGQWNEVQTPQPLQFLDGRALVVYVADEGDPVQGDDAH